MADSVLIRPLEERDVLAVSGILAECYRFLAERDQFTDHQLAALIETCAAPGCVRQLRALLTCFVAELGGAVVGFVAVREAVINELFVLPGFHRRGVGRALFRHVTARMRGHGYARVTLTTTGYGRPFYEAMGMRVTGQIAVTCGALIGRELLLLEGST